MGQLFENVPGRSGLAHQVEMTNTVLPGQETPRLAVGRPLVGDHMADIAADIGPSRRLLRDLPVAIYTTDARGKITFYNEAAATLWGLRPELGTAEWCGSWRLFWPDGRPMAHQEGPMAVALRETRAIGGAEVIAERPDGTRVTFLAYPNLIFDAAGVVIAAVNTLIDISDRKRAEMESQRLASIVESSDDAIVSTDLGGTILSWNKGAAQLFGYEFGDVVGRSFLMLVPSEHRDEEHAIIARIELGEHVKPYETTLQRKDGARVDISLTVSPIIDSHGAVVGASKIARDITDHKRAEMQQGLLMREMSHRVKNLFAVAASVVSLSARMARTPAEMGVAVRQRLQALTRAQELTRPGLLGSSQAPQRAELTQLVRTILSPYVDDKVPVEQQCARVEGPPVQVGEDIVTSLALLLHEFATNAAKYGALSVAGGRVNVKWRFDAGDLVFEWRETGGPALTGPPAHEGFGAVLAARTVNVVFCGSLRYDWRDDGLCIQLNMPAERLGLRPTAGG